MLLESCHSSSLGGIFESWPLYVRNLKDFTWEVLSSSLFFHLHLFLIRSNNCTSWIYVLLSGMPFFFLRMMYLFNHILCNSNRFGTNYLIQQTHLLFIAYRGLPIYACCSHCTKVASSFHWAKMSKSYLVIIFSVTRTWNWYVISC